MQAGPGPLCGKCHDALVQEGFTNSEALVVIGQWLAALQPGGGK